MDEPLVRLPLRTKDADWTWQYGDQMEYWWKRDKEVDGQEPMVVYASLAIGDDSIIEIRHFLLSEFKDQFKDMFEGGWHLNDGQVPVFCDVCPDCHGEGGHYGDVRTEEDQQKDPDDGGQIGWIDCQKCKSNGWIIETPEGQEIKDE